MVKGRQGVVAMPVTVALGRLRQEDCKLESGLGNLARPSEKQGVGAGGVSFQGVKDASLSVCRSQK